MKFTSIVLVLAFCNSLFFPTVGLALTSGPVQAEYIGYESGATDMVQLLTGDFSYSIPIMNVPSPEGGFSFPISYASGIQPSQKASWVGLGWSLNVGAITRTVSQFPDDAKGTVSLNQFKDPGVSGMESKAPGGILKMTYNYSQPNNGQGGIVNLGIMKIGFGSQEGFDGFGLTYKRGEKPHHDFVEIGLNVATIALTILFPPAGVTAQAALGTRYSTDAIVTLLVENIASGIYQVSNPYNGNFNMGNWDVTKTTTAWTPDPVCMSALWGVVTPAAAAIICARKKYHWSMELNKTNPEEMYGALYLGNLPKKTNHPDPKVSLFAYNGEEEFVADGPETYEYLASSDMHMNLSAEQLGENDQPSHVAYDNYQVMGQGVSGNIGPYRHDIGSLAIPWNLGTVVENFDVVPYTSDKVHFGYIGDAANRYSYHADGSDLKTPTAGFSFTSHIVQQLRTFEHYSKYRLLSDKLYDPAKRISSNRYGLNNGQLAGSKHVMWYSNAEIVSGAAEADGFIDIHASGTARTTFRNPLPQDGIGGFKVTAADGTTYHYALPVYVKAEDSYKGDYTGTASYNRRTVIAAHATTWLLTAVTGPDFYDRGTSGVIDEADWGGWTKMDYSLFAPEYAYRTPYHNQDKLYDPSGEEKGYSYAYGVRETYYLEKIQTRTHTALFVKDLRKDGKGHYYKAHGMDGDTKPASSLKLKEIILLTNEDHDKIYNSPYNYSESNGGTVSSYAQLQKAEKIDEIIDEADIANTTNLRTFLNEHQIQRVVFNQDYSLCDETLNSFDFDGSGNPPWTEAVSYTGKGGKLTLNSIEVYGRNNIKQMHDYDFEYASGSKNPNYRKEKWDKWGMYSASATDTYTGHEYLNSPLTNRDEDYWHLKKIITSAGTEIEVDYERDSYSEISGMPVAMSRDGGDVRVKRVTVRDEFEGQTTENVTEYEYKRFAHPAFSSGVISMTPPWSRKVDYPFYQFFDYPFTPVMYKNVAVLLGVRSDGSYLERKEYEFETPHFNKYDYEHEYVLAPTTTNVHTTKTFLGLKDKEYEYVERASHHKLFSNLWSVGRMNSMKEYNSRNHLVSAIKYNYVDKTNYHEYEEDSIPGLRTYGSFVSFKTDDQQKNSGTNEKQFGYFHNVSRTTKVFYPNVLQSMEMTSEGTTFLVENTKYDFITGTVLERQYSNGLGYGYASKSVPAYHVYKEMGTKVGGSTKRNMLTQPHQEYLKVTPAKASGYVKAAAHTWRKDWDGNDEAYRKHVSYTWSDAIEENGEFKSTFTEYTSGAVAPWKYNQMVSNYDEYSFPIESRSGRHFSSSRKDNDGIYVIASASNAMYAEFTFSDAEKELNSNSEFNGGLKAAGGTSRESAATIDTDPITGGVQPMEAHTGDYVYEIPYNGSLNFFTQIGNNTTAIPQDKVYRVSFWQHDLNFDEGGTPPNLKSELYGGTWTPEGLVGNALLSGETQNQTVSTVNCTTTQFGEWHLIEMDITVPVNNAKEIRIYLENPDSDPIYIDDFRFQPLNSSVEAKVLDYDSGTGRVRASLNNQNLGTKYVYYTASPYKLNRIKEVYKETIGVSGGFKKVLEKDYNIVK
jgi:hypothetical protein